LQFKLSNKKIIIFEILLILLAMLTIYKIGNNYQELYNATNNKLIMLQTADRLRQSSDDLTHFARTYVVTNNNKFKQQYYDTLDIRDGKKNRPLNYHSVYWDLDEKIRKINHPDSIKISLENIFNSLPYDKNEIEKLKLSKSNSDNLVNIEIEAFNAMVGKFKDDKGNYTIIAKPNQKLAIYLMHSEEYYKAKHKIMQPIDEFILMLDKRTSQNILDIHNQSKPLFLLLIAILLLFIIGNYFIYRFLNNQEKYKLEEKNILLLKQKKLNEQLVEKSKITQKLNRELEKSKYELQTINDNLENTIKKELEKNDKMHQQLFKSEKLALMGEMIGNIAHQWRQPLSVISTVATGMQLQKEYGTLNDEVFNTNCDTINNNAQFLSKTIDNFTDYIKGNNKKKLFVLNKTFDNLFNLLNGSIKNNNLNVIIDLEDDIKINGYEHDLIQCFMNIFNNAKDALFLNNIEEKYIFITARNIDNKVEIKFKDNGEGIPKDIIDKIFDPYFTTKHQSQGTGLGLSMTYKLITDEMDGEIMVENKDFIYNNKRYKGAEFIILIDTSI